MSDDTNNKKKHKRRCAMCGTMTELASIISKHSVAVQFDLLMGTKVAEKWNTCTFICVSHREEFKRRKKSDDSNNKKKPERRCAMCGTMTELASNISKHSVAVQFDLLMGTKLADKWSTATFICISHREEFERRKPPAAAFFKKVSSSTPVSKPGCHCCRACGRKEGVFETIDSFSHAQQIDRILGFRISDNWKGSAKICWCHSLEYGEKKKHFPERPLETTASRGIFVPRRVRCALCFDTFIPTPNDTAPPGNVYCSTCDEKRRHLTCSICGELIDVSHCVQINDIAMKARLNAFFRTNMGLDEHTLHMCSHHCNQWFDQHIKTELTVSSNSSESHDSGVLPNKQETKKETKKEFGSSVEMGHQSIDMKETTNNQLVKDEVINVEQLIGQGQKIKEEWE